MSQTQSQAKEQIQFTISPTLQEVFPYVESEKYELAIGQLTYQIFSIQQQIQDILETKGINSKKKTRGSKISPQNSANLQAPTPADKGKKQKNPVNNLLSMLYLDRGILEFCKGQVSESLSDLQRSLAFNYLNYCAYFNSHSIYLRMYEAFKLGKTGHKKMQLQFLQQSFNDICCSLSCLYLLFACICEKSDNKIQEQYIDKAIAYCSNNIDARLKKAFLLYNRKQYKNCKKMLNWIIEIGGEDKISRILSKIEKQNSVTEHPEPTDLSSMQPSQSTFMDFRLIFDTKSYFDNENMNHEEFSHHIFNAITEKETEFVDIYEKIHKIESSHTKIGVLKKVKVDLTKTMKVPQQGNDQHLVTNLYLLCRDHNDSILDENTQKPKNNVGLKKSKSLYDEILKESQLKSKKIENSSHKPQQEESIPIPIDEANQDPIQKNPEEDISSIHLKSDFHHIIDQKQSNQSLYLNSDKKKQSQWDNNPHNSNLDRSISELHTSLIESSSIVLQPLDQEKHLGISIHQVEILGSKSQCQKLNSLYCIFEYEEKTFKTVMVNDKYQQQVWDGQFQTPLGDQPKQLVIKVYNKQVLAFEDKFLGMASKEITFTGRIQVPLFSTEKKIGKLYLNIKYK